MNQYTNTYDEIKLRITAEGETACFEGYMDLFSAIKGTHEELMGECVKLTENPVEMRSSRVNPSCGQTMCGGQTAL